MGKFFRVLSLAAASCLLVCTGFLGTRTYAASNKLNGQAGAHVYIQDGAQLLMSNPNLFGSYNLGDEVPEEELYMPGDHLSSGTIDIENHSNDRVHLYMYALATDIDQYTAQGLFKSSYYSTEDLTVKSGELVEQIDLKITYHDVSGKSSVVYNGKMNGNDFGNGAMSGDQAIDLGTYSPGASGQLVLDLSLPLDLEGEVTTGGGQTISVGYANTIAMVDWVFTGTVLTSSTPTSPGGTPTSPEDDPPSGGILPTPYTGEETLPYLLATVACGVSALFFLLAAFSRKKEEEEESTRNA